MSFVMLFQAFINPNWSMHGVFHSLAQIDQLYYVLNVTYTKMNRSDRLKCKPTFSSSKSPCLSLMHKIYIKNVSLFDSFLLQIIIRHIDRFAGCNRFRNNDEIFIWTQLASEVPENIFVGICFTWRSNRGKYEKYQVFHDLLWPRMAQGRSIGWAIWSTYNTTIQENYYSCFSFKSR